MSIYTNNLLIDIKYHRNDKVLKLLTKDSIKHHYYDMNDNYQVLLCAVAHNNIPVVKMLIDHDYSKRKGGIDSHAIRLAVHLRHHDIVQLLLDSKLFNAGSNNNYCIREASSKGYIEIVNMLLLDKNVNPAVYENKPLYDSSRRGYHEIVRLLLTHPKVDPTDGDYYALRLALENKHFIVADILFQHEKLQEIDKRLLFIIKKHNYNHIKRKLLYKQNNGYISKPEKVIPIKMLNNEKFLAKIEQIDNEKKLHNSKTKNQFSVLNESSEIILETDTLNESSEITIESDTLNDSSEIILEPDNIDLFGPLEIENNNHPPGFDEIVINNQHNIVHNKSLLSKINDLENHFDNQFNDVDQFHKINFKNELLKLCVEFKIEYYVYDDNDIVTIYVLNDRDNNVFKHLFTNLCIGYINIIINIRSLTRVCSMIQF